MPANINSVTVAFGHGIKREEYGPTKKAEVSITAAVAEDEDGAVILHQLGRLALDKVADLLAAPKPEQYGKPAFQQAAEQVDAAETYGRSPAMGALSEERAEQERKRVEIAAADPPPARRTRGPNKPKEQPAAEAPAEQPAGEAVTTETDEWAAGAEDITVTDAELLSATSKRAGELGARDPIVKLIATFATRTEGAPFKVQEIPQAQRKDYLAKLAALTA